MSVTITNSTGAYVAGVDSNGNLATSALGLPGGIVGSYRVAGGPAGIVAAGLASDTNLANIWNAGTNILRVRRLWLSFSAATLGAAAGVAGSLGFQRISVANLSGGTARTPAAADPSGMAVTSVVAQDLASALTTTGVTFGDNICRVRQALAVVDGNHFTFEYRPVYPEIVRATQGITLRTRVACAATETWVFDWGAEWDEVAT